MEDSASAAVTGRVFIFTNEHTKCEIALSTGECDHYHNEMAPALDDLYPQKLNGP